MVIGVGDRLRELRLAKGLTLREVQEKSGLSSGHVSLIETGRVKNPSPSVLQRLADAYEVSGESLLILAGYLQTKSPKQRKTALHGVALSALKDLSEDEIAQVTALITVLRQRKKRAEQ